MASCDRTRGVEAVGSQWRHRDQQQLFLPSSLVLEDGIPASLSLIPPLKTSVLKPASPSALPGEERMF